MNLELYNAMVNTPDIAMGFAMFGFMVGFGLGFSLGFLGGRRR